MEESIGMKDRLKKMKNKLVKKAAMKGVMPLVYKKHAKDPVDPKKVIFLEMRMENISNSFSLLYKELTEKYDLDVESHFLRYSFVDGKTYYKNCVEFLEDAATASVIFLNDASNVVSAVPIRPETTVIQTWHACGAFKKFGLSTAEKVFGGTRNETLEFPYYENLDYVTVSSPEVRWAYAEAMNLEDKMETIVPTGVSRTDIFFDESYKESARKKLLEVMPSAAGKKVLLYAPTFRGRVSEAEAPDALEIGKLFDAFSQEYVLLIKHHPFVKNPPPVEEPYRNFAKDVGNQMSIEDLLFVSDVCISDYSSLIFEYSLFRRPMLFFAYDLDDYFDWRGFYYDYDTLTPGPIVKNNEELIQQLKQIDQLDLTPVDAFREKFMSSCDGHATERILKLAFGENLEKYRKES